VNPTLRLPGGQRSPRVIATARRTSQTTPVVQPRARFGWPWFWPVAVPVPVEVPVALTECPAPFADGRLVVTSRWATDCFAPAYEQARSMWGANAAALSTEVLLTLLPDAELGLPALGAEQELRRRIELAVAVLLGGEGIPVRYPPNPPSPRPPSASQINTPWIRALVTGWL
jgi:hypothetical protein